MNTSNMDKIIILNDLTALHVTGSDATRFLHAQFTNDLVNLPVNSWQYSGYCTPKGRLLAFMTIARTSENSYFLILPSDISNKILPRLRMYVMRDDVAFSLLEGNMVIAGIVGKPDSLAEIVMAAKETGNISANDNSYLLTIDNGKEGGSERYLCIADTDKITKLPLSPANRNFWTLLDIQAGIPSISAPTQEAFVPQMVNLDLIGAVNFKKGCYPGQEVVARVHYLGKIKQRMFILKSAGKSQSLPNGKIFLAGMEDKAIGTVVQAAAIDSGQLLQAVLQTQAVVENADIRLDSNDGERLIVEPQPYAVVEH